MLKKMFNFAMFVLSVALVCASMTDVSAKAFEQTQTMQDEVKEAGVDWDDIRHDHEGECYEADWVELGWTYNPILCKREYFHYTLTTEGEVIRFFFREHEVISVSRPAYVPLVLYTK